jgi:hypothetical protein
MASSNGGRFNKELNLHVGFIDLCFMCGKGFDVAGGLQIFITDGQAYEKYFITMAMIGNGQHILAGRRWADHARRN